ncbi:MAG: extracellular solute-binding protein [Spirochaetota bacterium]
MRTCIAAMLVIALAATSFATGTQEEADQGPIRIEFWHALGGSLGDELHRIIDDFNASQEQYDVDPVVVGSYAEVDEKLQAAYAGRNAPALVVGGSHNNYYERGLVAPFEDYMPESYDKDDIVGGFMDAAVRDGKMYFAPAYGTSQVLYFNEAVLSEAGATREDLATWQSLAGLADRVIGTDTNNQNTIEYVWEPMWGSGNIADMASSNGGTFLSEDGRTVTINSEPWVEVLEQVRVWIHEDETMRIHSGGQGWEYWYKTMDDWVYGVSLGYTGSPGDYIIALDAVEESVADGYKNDFAVAPQPGWGSHPPAPFFSSLMYFIPDSPNLSEQQKRGAAEFIAYATSTENTAAFAIATGYVAVRNSVLDLPAYQEYLETHPDADAPLRQIDQYAVPEFVDPTGGAITDALGVAVDEVQLENRPAREALDEAAARAQAELDKLFR